MAFFYLCPHCGKHFESPGACPVCHVARIRHQAAEDSPVPRYCTKCGTPVSIAGQSFCTSCGAPLGVQAPSSSRNAIPTPYPPAAYAAPVFKKKRPVWGIAGIVLSAVVILIFGFIIFLYSIGALSDNSTDHSDRWYQNNGGVPGGGNSSYSQGNQNSHTDARTIIVRIKYGTGADLDCTPSTADFVEVGLNIINTKESDISLYPTNFYLTNDETEEKIYPYTEGNGEKDPIRVSGNKTVSGALIFQIDPDASYHFNFSELDGTLVNSYELSK